MEPATEDECEELINWKEEFFRLKREHQVLTEKMRIMAKGPYSTTFHIPQSPRIKRFTDPSAMRPKAKTLFANNPRIKFILSSLSC